MAEDYNYKEVVKKDIKQFIKEEVNLDEFRDNAGDLDKNAAIEYIRSKVPYEDSVTGCWTECYVKHNNAEKNIVENLDLLVFMLEPDKDAYGTDMRGFTDDVIVDMLRHPELTDVALRQFVCGEMVPAALDEFLEEQDKSLSEKENKDNNVPDEPDKSNFQIYSYAEGITADLENLIRENIDFDSDDFKDNLGDLDKASVIMKVSDMAWDSTSVTGNPDSMYAHTFEEAEGYLAGNFDLLADAIEELGINEENPLVGLADPIGLDVTIRCHMVDRMIPDALDNVLDEMEEALEAEGRIMEDNPKNAECTSVSDKINSLMQAVDEQRNGNRGYVSMDEPPHA